MYPPPKMNQKISKWCAATCVVSVNNALGGNGTIADGCIGDKYFDSSSGFVNDWSYGFTKRTGTISIDGIKQQIDNGYYVFVKMTGTGKSKEHWVVAYEFTGSGGSRDSFSVMDPADGTHKLLSEAFSNGSYTTLANVFYAVK